MDVRNDKRVNPEPLLARSRSRVAETGPIGSRAARSIITQLLNQSTVGRLELIDNCDGFTRNYAPDRGLANEAGDRRVGEFEAGDYRVGDYRVGEYEATVEIHDPRAWTALLREGSIGFGRGYIERWWTSPDPTALVRYVIANLAPLDNVRNDLSRYVRPLSERIRRLLPRHDRAENRDQIASHYDLGNDFFQLFLDDTMTYSSAVFPHPAASLAEASRHKYDLVIEGLDLGPDHHLLEIGTGWGGLAIRAAQQTGCRVTTTTISSEQLRLATQRVQEAGLSDQITVLDQDWRDLRGKFDRVASIEMIEAVDWRDYRRFFATIERCLQPEGRALLQAICVPDRRYHRTKKTEDFIRRFIFPGGFLPSLGSVIDAVAGATHMQIVGVSDFSAHYAETLRRWRSRFDQRQGEVLALGLDERFMRLWRFYLSYCEAGFLERHCTVNHITLAGRRWRPTINGVPPALT